MSEAPLYLGIDAGSSVTKAVLFEADGRLVSIAARRSGIQRKNGRVEMDPEMAWEILVEVVRDVLAHHSAEAGRVAGLGVAGAMVGAWIVDSSGRALGPGINWEDSRAQPLLDTLIAANPSFLDIVFRTSGSALQQGCTLPLMAWFDRNEPNLLDRASHVLGYKDFLRLRLTGEAATDETEASVAPGDTRVRGFSSRMLTLFGLQHRASLLPQVRAPGDQAGCLTATAAAATGLPPGLPVAIGAGDVPANVIGAGALGTGTATLILGTTCMVGVTHDRPIFTPPNVGLLFPVPGGRWFRAMVNVAGTMALDWALDLLCPDWGTEPDRFKRAEALAAEAPIGAKGATFLPYLSESGIIAPVVDPLARAEFSGLVPGHGRAEMLRAVYEGVAFAVADLAETLGTAGELVAIGGGTRSPLWMQMIADILGKTVSVPEGHEFGARGAAMLAASAASGASGADPLLAMVCRTGTIYHPRNDRRYADALKRYRLRRDRALGTSRWRHAP